MTEPTLADRNRVVVLFALSGAASGVLIAMLCLTTGGDGFGKTDIEESTVLTLVTTVLGSVAGKALSESHVPSGCAVTIGVLLLTGLLGAAMGWIVGDALMWPGTPPRSPTRSAGTGSLVGFVVGFLLLAPRWLRRA